jgi:hypothetical protein
MTYEVSAEDVYELLREYLPVGSPTCTLEFVETSVRSDAILAVFRLVHWELDEAGGQSITDVKEQEVLFVPESCRDSRERVAAFCRAWAAVVGEAIRAMGGHDRTGSIMPHELMHPAVLKLARAETEEDFQKALRVKSRFGGILAQAKLAGSGGSEGGG